MTDYIHVDLCSGLGGWQAPFKADPAWTSVGIDIREDLNADVIGDVRQLPIVPTVDVTLLTMSPPCTEFSAAWNAVTPPDERDPDMSIYHACLEAVEILEPAYWILENVAQAQRWFGESRKHVGSYHFWGEFPPFDATAPPKGPLRDDRANVTSSELAAKIPAPIARALKQSVELYL